ncbi:MAG: hypothetical protein FMNOHCHN_01331 [Ignavibacteriaceae bacterium]|nr:hypothetical protein [Ignavibacteriaceae bacterium]MCK6615725.1 DUF1987 domain-containing protein [Ignavibacteriaceae bacterium]
MENLVIYKTKSTLAVNFDARTGILELSGSSYPENTSEFFQPLITWIQNYFLQVTKPLTLNLKIDYLNSSSIKFLSDIIDKLQHYYKSGGEVEINWYYKEDDEDMKEMGEEIKEDVAFKFNLIVS